MTHDEAIAMRRPMEVMPYTPETSTDARGAGRKKVFKKGVSLAQRIHEGSIFNQLAIGVPNKTIVPETNNQDITPYADAIGHKLLDDLRIRLDKTVEKEFRVKDLKLVKR